jgi:hypothetical protein
MQESNDWIKEVQLSQDEPETPVIFRKWKQTGHAIAFFPTLPSAEGVVTCLSYEKIGQHGDADYTYCLQHTRPAKEWEYAKLLAELIEQGYTNLRIYKRYQHRFTTERLAAIRKIAEG